MKQLHIPAIHLPDGKDLFRPLPYRPSVFKKVLKNYAERSLLEMSEGDGIILPSKPDEVQLQFLRDNGMALGQVEVCCGKHSNFAEDVLADEPLLHRLAGQGYASAEFYIHLEEEQQIARRLGMAETTEPVLTHMFNRFYFMQRMVEDLGLPIRSIAPLRSSRFYKKAEELLERWGSLFIRGNGSVGGVQVFTATTKEQLRQIEKVIQPNSKITRYFAQRLEQPEHSYNLQYIIDGGFTLLGGSSQLLKNGTAHIGNLGGNLPEAAVEIGNRIAERLLQMAARGRYGIDMMVVHGQIIPVEINGRRNSSTPTLTLCNRLSEQNGVKLHWAQVQLATVGGITFKQLASSFGDAMFSADRLEGCIPFHLSSSRATGKVDVAVLAGSGQRLKQLLQIVEQL